ncbi:hypothetical protein [Microlunatus speluncae]|uniref:hypothetical protein n=1 Tax=Microlunatus speluncae TaxID=2594267 RepID=UPI00126613ED|nr:hypothetical protein [Microlunatus speluncae]
MTGAAASAPTTITRESTEQTRDGWPRDFGRDGVSGLVTLDRAMRARDVSLPTPEDDRLAESVLAELLARAEGRRPRRP